MNKYEYEIYNNLEIYSSFRSGLVSFKVTDPANYLEKSKEIIKADYDRNLLSGSGVYFISMESDFYIGEAKNLEKRFNEHLKDKEINSITFITTKTKKDMLNKDSIKDMESIIIDYALEMQIPLRNIKNEKRKSLNNTTYRINKDISKLAWDSIIHLNIDEFFEYYSTKEIQKKANDEIPLVNEQIKNKKSIARNMSFETGSVIQMKNVSIASVPEDLEIFKYIPRRDSIAKAYNKENIEVFKDQAVFKCLKMYLYNGKGNSPVDIILTEGRRNRGWVTAATIASFRIETKGTARGSLSDINEDQVDKMINELIEKSL